LGVTILGRSPFYSQTTELQLGQRRADPHRGGCESGADIIDDAESRVVPVPSRRTATTSVEAVDAVDFKPFSVGTFHVEDAEVRH
jgi:hypothetical protein